MSNTFTFKVARELIDDVAAPLVKADLTLSEYLRMSLETLIANGAPPFEVPAARRGVKCRARPMRLAKEAAQNV